MTRYVALLRGVNVGGKNAVKMAALRAALASSGYGNVRTLLASGNAAFDAAEADAGTLATKIEAMLKSEFGRAILVAVRTTDQIQALVASAPFASVEVTPQTRLYITFLSHPPSVEAMASVPPAGVDLAIVRVTPTEVCSVLTLARTDSVSAMAELERRFGARVTTRNWNTVVKLASL
jgi:uncharacterized protein (DUF1697 family)